MKRFFVASLCILLFIAPLLVCLGWLRARYHEDNFLIRLSSSHFQVSTGRGPIVICIGVDAPPQDLVILRMTDPWPGGGIRGPAAKITDPWPGPGFRGPTAPLLVRLQTETAKAQAMRKLEENKIANLERLISDVDRVIAQTPPEQGRDAREIKERLWKVKSLSQDRLTQIIIEERQLVMACNIVAAQAHGQSYLGFGYIGAGSGKGTVPSKHILSIPYGFILLITLLPALLILRKRLTRLRRNRRGLCPVCGYDLRASKDLCPECGTPIPRSISTPLVHDVSVPKV